MRSTLLLLATDPDILIDVANAARAAGYLVVPGRHLEPGVDALARVDADVVLVHVLHDAADSTTFGALAVHLGVPVFLFASRRGSAAERARVSLVGGQSTFPLLEYTADAAEMIREVGGRMG